MNKENQPHPALPPCSICGAGPEKRKWTQLSPGGYGSGQITLFSEKKPTFWQGMSAELSQASPVVCTQCGYVQFFVNPEDFREDPSPT